MSDSDQIKQPDEPVFSSEALATAEAHLADDQRDILSVDQDSLNQSTSSAAFILSQALGLTEAATSEIQEALTSRLSQLPPIFHEYLNQLFSKTVEIFQKQTGHRDSDESSVIRLLPANPTSTNAQHDPSSLELDQSGSIETDSLETEADTNIIVLPEGLRLLSYASTGVPIEMDIFLKNVLRTRRELLGDLSSDKKSLLAYQLLVKFRDNSYYRRSEETRQMLYERVASYIGLFSKRVTIAELSRSIDVSQASIYAGMNRTMEKIEEIVDDFDELILKAKTSSAEGDRDDLFIGDNIKD